MIICIVGLGLLGGSFALALKAKQEKIKLIGVDKNETNAQKALELGIIDEISDFETGVKTADLIVLATPVGVLLNQLPKALDLIQDKAILIDLGSTKEALCKAVVKHKNRRRYVSLHPIAGTENSGPEAAFKELLSNKSMIVCDAGKSDIDALNKILGIIESLEMRVMFMDSVEHDLHISYVSHLSHISSFALGLTVLDKNKDERNIFHLAGSGFSSTVRLAKSSPEMWAPIFEQNSQNISEALGSYIMKLLEFKEIIDTKDKDRSKEAMKQANTIREILKGLNE